MDQEDEAGVLEQRMQNTPPPASFAPTSLVAQWKALGQPLQPVPLPGPRIESMLSNSQSSADWLLPDISMSQASSSRRPSRPTTPEDMEFSFQRGISGYSGPTAPAVSKGEARIPGSLGSNHRFVFRNLDGLQTDSWRNGSQGGWGASSPESAEGDVGSARFPQSPTAARGLQLDAWLGSNLAVGRHPSLLGRSSHTARSLPLEERGVDSRSSGKEGRLYLGDLFLVSPGDSISSGEDSVGDQYGKGQKVDAAGAVELECCVQQELSPRRAEWNALSSQEEESVLLIRSQRHYHADLVPGQQNAALASSQGTKREDQDVLDRGHKSALDELRHVHALLEEQWTSARRSLEWRLADLNSKLEDRAFSLKRQEAEMEEMRARELALESQRRVLVQEQRTLEQERGELSQRIVVLEKRAKIKSACKQRVTELEVLLKVKDLRIQNMEEDTVALRDDLHKEQMRSQKLLDRCEGLSADLGAATESLNRIEAERVVAEQERMKLLLYVDIVKKIQAEREVEKQEKDAELEEKRKLLQYVEEMKQLEALQDEKRVEQVLAEEEIRKLLDTVEELRKQLECGPPGSAIEVRRLERELERAKFERSLSEEERMNALQALEKEREEARIERDRGVNAIVELEMMSNDERRSVLEMIEGLEWGKTNLSQRNQELRVSVSQLEDELKLTKEAFQAHVSYTSSLLDMRGFLESSSSVATPRFTGDGEQGLSSSTTPQAPPQLSQHRSPDLYLGEGASGVQAFLTHTELTDTHTSLSPPRASLFDTYSGGTLPNEPHLSATPANFSWGTPPRGSPSLDFTSPLRNHISSGFLGGSPPPFSHSNRSIASLSDFFEWSVSSPSNSSPPTSDAGRSKYFSGSAALGGEGNGSARFRLVLQPAMSGSREASMLAEGVKQDLAFAAGIDDSMVLISSVQASCIVVECTLLNPDTPPQSPGFWPVSEKVQDEMLPVPGFPSHQSPQGASPHDAPAKAQQQPCQPSNQTESGCTDDFRLVSMPVRLVLADLLQQLEEPDSALLMGKHTCNTKSFEVISGSDRISAARLQDDVAQTAVYGSPQRMPAMPRQGTEKSRPSPGEQGSKTWPASSKQKEDIVNSVHKQISSPGDIIHAVSAAHTLGACEVMRGQQGSMLSVDNSGCLSLSFSGDMGCVERQLRRTEQMAAELALKTRALQEVGIRLEAVVSERDQLATQLQQERRNVELLQYAAASSFICVSPETLSTGLKEDAIEGSSNFSASMQSAMEEGMAVVRVKGSSKMLAGIMQTTEEHRVVLKGRETGLALWEHRLLKDRMSMCICFWSEAVRQGTELRNFYQGFTDRWNKNHVKKRRFSAWCAYLLEASRVALCVVQLRENFLKITVADSFRAWKRVKRASTCAVRAHESTGRFARRVAFWLWCACAQQMSSRRQIWAWIQVRLERMVWREKCSALLAGWHEALWHEKFWRKKKATAAAMKTRPRNLPQVWLLWRCKVHVKLQVHALGVRAAWQLCRAVIRRWQLFLCRHAVLLHCGRQTLEHFMRGSSIEVAAFLSACLRGGPVHRTDECFRRWAAVCKRAKRACRLAAWFCTRTISRSLRRAALSWAELTFGLQAVARAAKVMAARRAVLDLKCVMHTWSDVVLQSVRHKRAAGAAQERRTRVLLTRGMKSWHFHVAARYRLGNSLVSMVHNRERLCSYRFLTSWGAAAQAEKGIAVMLDRAYLRRRAEVLHENVPVPHTTAHTQQDAHLDPDWALDSGVPTATRFPILSGSIQPPKAGSGSLTKMHAREDSWARLRFFVRVRMGSCFAHWLDATSMRGPASVRGVSRARGLRAVRAWLSAAESARRFREAALASQQARASVRLSTALIGWSGKVEKSHAIVAGAVRMVRVWQKQSLREAFKVWVSVSAASVLAGHPSFREGMSQVPAQDCGLIDTVQKWYKDSLSLAQRISTTGARMVRQHDRSSLARSLHGWFLISHIRYTRLHKAAVEEVAEKAAHVRLKHDKLILSTCFSGLTEAKHRRDIQEALAVWFKAASHNRSRHSLREVFEVWRGWSTDGQDEVRGQAFLV